MFRCTYQNTSFTVAPVDGKADASDLEDERLVSPFEAMIILLKIGISRNMILLWIVDLVKTKRVVWCGPFLKVPGLGSPESILVSNLLCKVDAKTKKTKRYN